MTLIGKYIDAHMAEKLGRLARVLTLFICLLLAVAAPCFMLMGFSRTIAMSRSRAALSDAIGSEGGYSMLHITAEPIASAKFPQWFWILDGGRLIDSPTGRSGHSLYRYTEISSHNRYLQSRVNPYAGSASCNSATAWLYPKKTSMVLLDSSLFAPSASADVDRGTSVINNLPFGVNTGYLYCSMPVDYFDVRDMLNFHREAPHLLACGPGQYEIRPKRVLWMLDRVRGFLKRKPVVITADPELAEIAISKDCKTVLLDARGTDTLNLRHVSDISMLPIALSGWIK